MDVIQIGRETPVDVERWPTETELTVSVVVVSIIIWVLLFVSVIGILYVGLFGAFFFMAHVAAVAHIRGSAIRLAPDQMPDLHVRVEQLATRFGMPRTPEAYLMQAGGALNAFATRFLRSDMLVLYSDLLEACGEDTAARDMIIAHELGHLREGHVKWMWLMTPARLVPFLGSALSRAREYTCDRYGFAGAGNRDGALLGLTILAAGGPRARQVNRQRFVLQREQLNTGWMRLGEWMGSHPPLARRLAALDPALDTSGGSTAKGNARALGIIAATILLFLAGMVALAFSPFARAFNRAMTDAAQQNASIRAGQASGRVKYDTIRQGRVPDDLIALSGMLATDRVARRPYPATVDELYAHWRQLHPDTPAPLDPYTHRPYGYEVQDGHYRLWSVGPDGRPGGGDDIVFRGP